MSDVSFECKECGSDMVITWAEEVCRQHKRWLKFRVTCKGDNGHWVLYRLPIMAELDVLHKDGSL